MYFLLYHAPSITSQKFLITVQTEKNVNVFSCFFLWQCYFLDGLVQTKYKKLDWDDILKLQSQLLNKKNKILPVSTLHSKSCNFLVRCTYTTQTLLSHSGLHCLSNILNSSVSKHNSTVIDEWQIGSSSSSLGYFTILKSH